MRTKASSETNNCPIAQALGILGDAWPLLILRDAGAGIVRFDDFRKHLSIAPNILTRRLGALTSAGLLERYPYSERPPRFAYRLTETGQDALPILSAMGDWYTRNAGSIASASSAQPSPDEVRSKAVHHDVERQLAPPDPASDL